MHHRTNFSLLAAALVLALTTVIGEPLWLLAGCGVALIAAVLAAVHHAKVIAHRIGEPFGTLVLAFAVTVIEAALLLSLLVAGGTGMETLPRDAAYATVMIITTGVVGLCTLIGGLAALVVLAVVMLALPNLMTMTAGATYSRSQVFFAAVISAALWVSSSSCRPSGTATTSCRTTTRPTPANVPCPRLADRRE